MAYAQKNYGEGIGIPPTKYTIAQVGCFLTAFCNLRERFGRPVDPPTLNAYFRDHGLYVDVDDGVRDDLAWSTISGYDPNIVITDTGGAGTPPSDNAIVKFIYNGGQTHFCLVADRNAGTIVDSWDGQVKSWNVYGGVKAWATYKDNLGGGNDEMADYVTAETLPDLVRGFLFREPNADDSVHIGKTYPQAIADFIHSPQRGDAQARFNSANPTEAEVRDAFAKYQPWQPIDTPPYTDQSYFYTQHPWSVLLTDLGNGLIAKANNQPPPAPTIPPPTPDPSPAPTPTPQPPAKQNWISKVIGAILGAFNKKG